MTNDLVMPPRYTVEEDTGELRVRRSLLGHAVIARVCIERTYAFIDKEYECVNEKVVLRRLSDADINTLNTLLAGALAKD